MTTSVPEEQTEKVPATAKKKAGVGKPRAQVAPSKPKPARKAAGAKKAATGRHGGKTAKILDLLKRSGGASLKELVKATGWQSHSVRGFLSGTVGKKMAISVKSFKSATGERCYRISSK